MKKNVIALVKELEIVVSDCINYGHGDAKERIGGKPLRVVADWAENEKDIDVVIYEDNILRFSYTEENMV